ncbi:MAG: peptide chain release factor N(5)-glutamine methyltransferase [Gemmataceae bacterium]
MSNPSPHSHPLATGSPAQPSAADAQSWTIGGLLDWTANFLAKKGVEFPRLDTEVLLAEALHCKRLELYTRYGEEASDAARTRFRELIRQRLEGCPVAYLVGRKEFFSLELEVNRHVLIPRPESEFVVMECLRLAKGMTAPRVLDIGTGSGNLAVTIAHQVPDAQVTAVDLSPDALAVARRNAAKHQVAERIRFLQGDLFQPISADETFDFILSNPPYIAHEDLDQLPVGVRYYEPELALDGGPGGYVLLERIIAAAGNHLVSGGYLIFEIGAPQEAEVRRRLAARGGYELQPTIHDYSGHPRVVVGRFA